MEPLAATPPGSSGAQRLARPAAVAAALCLALLASGARGSVERELAYAGAGGDAERSLDLYLPAASAGKPPLVAFVHSRFWRFDDRRRTVEAGFARALQSEGVAVAVIRHRLAPAHRHPAAAEDVAAALAFLIARADDYGYDADRIFAAGHGSGAQLAALVALDGRYLAAHGLAPERLAGVIAISGVYDLDPPEGVSEEELAWYEDAFGGRGARRDASPLAHVRADAPPFLVLTAERDVPGYQAAALAFAEALRAAGHPSAEAFAALGRNHLTILDLSDERNAARRHLLAFVGAAPLSPQMSELYAARRYWRDPGYSTEGFWEQASRIHSYDATPHFLETANRLFGAGGRTRWLVRPERYHAIDLLEYLEALGESGAGRGDYLTATNARGERAVWRLDALRALRPRIVVGLDDERNLFRITDVYHTLREYSWKGREPEPVTMARPLGAFLYVPEPSPDLPGHPVIGRFGLTPGSFRRSESDPLAPVRDLPPALADFVLREMACLGCHAFRGVGAQAAHMRASDGALVGGRGLPLEAYPEDVWRRYVFEQPEVAAEIGASEVPIPEPLQPLLYELVVRERGGDGAAGEPPREPAQ